MPNPITSLTISCSAPELAAELGAEIDRQAGSQSRLSKRRNLDGDVAAWIVLANLAAQALPHVLTFLGQLLDRQPAGVKRLKLGDIEIENPTRADVDLLLAQATADQAGNSGDG